MLFAKSTMGFYENDSSHAPDDAFEITDELYNQLKGQVVIIGADGIPERGESTSPTRDQLIAFADETKLRLLSEASILIAPLQDAFDLDEATEHEKTRLREWKQYRIAVNRTDTSFAPDINWPEPPEELMSAVI